MEHEILPSACVHALPGRLRVKLAAIKRAPAVAEHLEQVLRRDKGIKDAVANPLTGSLLVHYDPQRTSSQAILSRLVPYGLSSRSTPAPSSALADFSTQLGKELGKELLKMALAEMVAAGPMEVLFALI
jgi:allophanate hydrolase subunit 1